MNCHAAAGGIRKKMHILIRNEEYEILVAIHILHTRGDYEKFTRTRKPYGAEAAASSSFVERKKNYPRHCFIHERSSPPLTPMQICFCARPNVLCAAAAPLPKICIKRLNQPQWACGTMTCASRVIIEINLSRADGGGATWIKRRAARVSLNEWKFF